MKNQREMQVGFEWDELFGMCLFCCLGIELLSLCS